MAATGTAAPRPSRHVEMDYRRACSHRNSEPPWRWRIPRPGILEEELLCCLRTRCGYGRWPRGKRRDLPPTSTSIPHGRVRRLQCPRVRACGGQRRLARRPSRQLPQEAGPRAPSLSRCQARSTALMGADSPSTKPRLRSRNYERERIDGGRELGTTATASSAGNACAPTCGQPHP